MQTVPDQSSYGKNTYGTKPAELKQRRGRPTPLSGADGAATSEDCLESLTEHTHPLIQQPPCGGCILEKPAHSRSQPRCSGQKLETRRRFATGRGRTGPS